MPHIYNTGSCGTDFEIGGRVISINGRNQSRLVGVAGHTQVSQEELAELEKQPSFIQMKRDGFITVTNKEFTDKATEKHVTQHMTAQDNSAQETEESIAKKTKAKKA